jgi:hypothetical protein
MFEAAGDFVECGHFGLADGFRRAMQSAPDLAQGLMGHQLVQDGGHGGVGIALADTTGPLALPGW